MADQILDPLDWKILLEYDRDPFQSFNAISKKVGVHHSTVSDRIDSMKERDILQKDIKVNDVRVNSDGSFYEVEREITEVHGTYSPARVGLTRLNILFRRIQSVKDFKILQKFCSDHPYTHYQSQLYGSGVTLFAQFDVPDDAIDIHLDTFRALKDDYSKFESFEVYQDTYEAKSDLNVESQIESAEADMSENSINSIWHSFLDTMGDVKLDKPKQEKKFDNLDAELIRELGLNGKVNISSLSDYYHRDKSTLSRRMSKIRENFVTEGRLLFGDKATKVHGFNNTQIVTGRFTGENELNWENFTKFINHSDTLPFDAFITVEDDRFLLYTEATIGIAGDIMQFLYNNSDPFYLNQYQFYINQAKSYPYWYGNYDENSGYNTSKEYIMDKPLELLKI